MGQRRKIRVIFFLFLVITPLFGICFEFFQKTNIRNPSEVVAPTATLIDNHFWIATKIITFEGKIIGYGLPSSVTLLCNKSGGPAPTNSNANIGVSIPTPWSIVYSNLSLMNILQKSSIVVMEDSITALSLDIEKKYYAMQFNVSGVALIKNFSMYVYKIQKLDSLSVTIYNAKLLSSRPCPDSILYSETFLTLPYQDATPRWYNLTFSSLVALNASNTYNNAFFIELYPSTGAAGSFNWGYESDTGNADNGAAYQYVTPNWVLQAVDFNLKVGLINKSRTPSEVNLRVNGTSVKTKNVNDGEWISTIVYSYLNNTINFQFSANTLVDFMVKWAISYRFIALNEVNTSFQGVNTEAIINWNATYSATFLAGSFDKRLYFDLPAWQSVINVRRNQNLHTFWNSSIGGSVRSVLVRNADSGSWVVQCTDKNYVENVFAKRAGIIISAVNSTDVIDIYGNFTEILTTGDANLTIFPSIANYNDTVGEQIINNKTIKFNPAWSMINTALGSYSEAKLQLQWFNGTAAGIKIATLTVNHVPTNLTIISSTKTIISGASIFIIAKFTNQYTKAPLVGASLLVKNSTDKTTWPTPFQIIRDYLNGTYKIEVLSLGLSGGRYSLSINFSKSLYFSSEIPNINVTIGGATSNVSVTAPNCVGLQYINQSYALADPAPYHNSSVKVTIYYFSNFTLEPLRNAIITLSWIGGGSEGTWIPAFFGYYNITIDVTGFHSGTNHTLRVQIQEIGYITADLYIIVPVKKLPTRIEPLSSSYYGYKEETLNIYAIFQDTHNDKSIPSIYNLNGNFTIRIGNFIQNMTLISPTIGIYSYILSLSSLGLVEGVSCNITFSAFSSEHEFATINVSFYIIPKTKVNLSILDEPEYLLAGTQFKMYAKLTDVNGTPIYNVPLIAKYIFQPSSLEMQDVQLTNGSGVAQFSGEASSLMQSLRIQIAYEGNMTLQNCTIYSGIIPIIKLNSSLTLGLHPPAIQTGENIALNATLSINGTLAADKVVTFTFTYQGSDRVDAKLAITSAAGIATVNLTVPRGVSKIFISAVYGGMSYVNASNVVSEIVVHKLDSSLTLITGPKYLLAGTQFNIYAKLTDLNDTPIYNVPLIAKYIFQPGSLQTQDVQLTNGSGVAQFSGEASSLMQSLRIQIAYEGNITLQNCTIYSNIIPIIKLSSSLTLGLHPPVIQTGKNLALNATLSINATLAADKVVIFTFTFQGSDRVDVKPAVTSVMGLAKVNLTMPLGVSKIYISAAYGGMSYVNASNDKSEIVVQKLGSSLTLYPLPLEILEGETLTAQARLLINGTPAADQIIRFIFTYTGLEQVDELSVGTDSEGNAFASLIVPSGARRIYISVSYDGINYVNATSVESELTIISFLTLIVRAAPYWGSAIALAIGALLFYDLRYRRPKIRNQLKKLREIEIKFEDIKHMNYLLFLHKKNGVPLFEYPVKIADLNPVLIGGFLNAISSFKDSIIQSEKKTQAERWELEYENFKISWVTGELAIFSILSEKKLSESTRRSIANLLTAFEETYRNPLAKFSGDVKIFLPTSSLIKKHLEIDLIRPHKVDFAKIKEIKHFIKVESALISLAISLQEELGQFFISKLVSTAASARGESELKVLGVIYDLWKRGIFLPIPEEGPKAKEPEGKKSKEDRIMKKEDIS